MPSWRRNRSRTLLPAGPISKFATSILFIPITFLPSTACSTSPVCSKEPTVSNLACSQRRAADVAFRAAALSREGGGTSISLDKSAGPPGMSRLTNRFPLLSGLNAIPSPHNLGHC